MSCRISTTLTQRLNLCGLEPPEPMRRALEAIEALDVSDLLEIVTDREPMLLQRELDRRGYRYVSAPSADSFLTSIRRRKNLDLKP